MIPRMEKDTCMNPMCDRTAKTRGLCPSCYNSAMNSVKYGSNTDEGLVAAGKMLPAHTKSKSAWFKEVVR